MMKQVSPCLHCTRVPHPEDCDDKKCVLWRRWFIGRWDALRLQYGQGVEQRPEQGDPCDGCLYPKELCVLPCRARQEWEEKKQEVLV